MSNDTSKGLERQRRVNAGKKKYQQNLPDTSQYRGVTRMTGRRKKPFKASIKHNGKKIHIGMFASEIDAAKAYDQMAIQLKGSSAITNF